MWPPAPRRLPLRAKETLNKHRRDGQAAEKRFQNQTSAPFPSLRC